MDERRIYYRMTPLGRRVLAAEMTRLRALVHAAERTGILTPERA
jgi:DNA-binding PadR family transcriptional regulator